MKKFLGDAVIKVAHGNSNTPSLLWDLDAGFGLHRELNGMFIDEKVLPLLIFLYCLNIIL